MAEQRVLIATPAYGAQVSTGYTRSLLQLTHSLPEASFTLQFLNYALICKQRNFFISRLLQDDFTHLLFVDADMSFSPATIQSLLALNQPVAACAYPARSLNWAKLHTASQQNYRQANTLKAQALDFVCEAALAQGTAAALDEDKTTLHLEAKQYIRCQQAGTGLMLIQKTVPQQLKDCYPELWLEQPRDPYTAFGALPGILQCFESLPNAQGQHLSEDLAFCQRWTQGCGGDIWVNVTDPIGHSGQLHVESAWLDRWVVRDDSST